MKKNIPIMSYKDTLYYINSFKEKLLLKLKNYFNFIDLDLPMVCNSNESFVNKNLNLRKINFDNKNDKLIYEIILFNDNWIRYNSWWLDLMPKDCLFSTYHYIDRDTNVSSTNTIDNLVWNFEICVREEERDINQVNELLLLFWSCIVKTTNDLTNLFTSSLPLKVNSYSFKSILKKHFLLSQKDVLSKFTSDKNVIILHDVLYQEKSLTPIIVRPASAYDFNMTSCIIASDKYSDDSLNLVELTFRPNWTIYAKQTNWTSQSKESDFEKILQLDNKPMTVSIKINLGKLLYFILDKTDIKEIPFCNSEFSLTDMYFFFNKKNN